MGGKEEYIYQYHTASIMDGRDEREQFVFNNIRALYDLITGIYRKEGKTIANTTDIRHLEKELYETKKAVRKLRTLQLIETITVMGLFLLWILRNLQ